MEIKPPPAKVPKLSEGEEEQEKVIRLLEERLEKHDNNRKIVQDKFKELQNKLRTQIDELEERIAKELEEKFVPEEDRLQRALNELHGNSSTSALQKAKAELCVVQSYEIIENKKAKLNLTTLYKLKTKRRAVPEDDHVGFAISGENSSAHSSSNTTEKDETAYDSDNLAEERERLVKLLEERLEKHDQNRKAVQDKLHEICERLRAQINELEDRVNKELEEKFTPEDNRFQAALNELHGNRTANALQKAKAELLVEQLYKLIENKKVKHDLTTLYKLKTERRIILELTKMRKPTNVRVTGVNRGITSVQFTYLNPDEERVLSDRSIVNPVKYKCLFFKKDNEQENKEEYPLDKNEGNNSSSSFTFAPDIFEAETTYGIRVKMVVEDRESEWSDITEFTTPEFKECCVWKECPDDVDNNNKYRVDEKNPRIATKTRFNWRINSNFCTTIGNTPIPLNTVTSWSINILKPADNGRNIYFGIAPNDIDQNKWRSYNYCGWYFYCYRSSLHSGPPHNYRDKIYGPRKGEGEYVHDGDNVGVVVDTTKGELSFALNGVNFGVAYERIPLDGPLVPCVILFHAGDSVELDTSEVEETKIDSSFPIPSNIATGITWDTVTLTWDEVADASFYQIEVDGSKSWDATAANSFIKRGLLPETEHSFRVRTAGRSSVSEWSSIVKVRTLKIPEFSECVWKECPGHVDLKRKYRVDEENPRVATKVCGGSWRVSDDYCTIIGDTPIPFNTITSWSVKVVESKNNDGDRIHIGVAPFDINQNEVNYSKCGWYFDCYRSTLCSGPKKKNGEYVHTGDSVGVVMDTIKGGLSFALNGVNRGVAFEGIPLDKPLVPCVLLKYKDDSVELDTSEVKDPEVDSSISVPSKIIAKSIAWDTITLAWNKIKRASFYQIEVDGNKHYYASTTNAFTKTRLLPRTEHSFRVRTVRGSSVSKWSNIAKGRTLKTPEFKECCVWKECPDDVHFGNQYSVDGRNPRVATKIVRGHCTTIGNTPISPNKVTSWNIKVLSSKNNDGDNICIGVAPFDINQDIANYDKYGWYFDCYRSTLYSGSPHNYSDKEYGPRKDYGQYVHTGDSVGVVMDTKKGELSFILNGTNLGVAYEGIPLDKPLVPCVLLGWEGDSVELII